MKPELKARLSKASKKAWANPVTRAKMEKHLKTKFVSLKQKGQKANQQKYS